MDVFCLQKPILPSPCWFMFDTIMDYWSYLCLFSHLLFCWLQLCVYFIIETHVSIHLSCDCSSFQSTIMSKTVSARSVDSNIKSFRSESKTRTVSSFQFLFQYFLIVIYLVYLLEFVLLTGCSNRVHSVSNYHFT